MVDAEKALNRVKWDYLFTILSKFGLGDPFISWIRLLYTSPFMALSLHTSCRGTRQGCPLSPLLFASAVEPLSNYLRFFSTFTGISPLGMEFELSLYDLLLYVSDPGHSIPEISSCLHKFGSFSGYKINISKSECYLVNALALQLNQTDTAFKLNLSGFKYLGINVTRTLTSLFFVNFSSLMFTIKSDLQRWRSLP